MLAVEVRTGLNEGAFTTEAGVFGGAVVAVEMDITVDLLVITKEDVGAERFVEVTGNAKGFVVVGARAVMVLALTEGSEAGVESELSLTEGVEDLVKVVGVVLGLEMGEEVVVAFDSAVKGWGEVAVGTAT